VSCETKAMGKGLEKGGAARRAGRAKDKSKFSSVGCGKKSAPFFSSVALPKTHQRLVDTAAAPYVAKRDTERSV
jgi:hypothetical protein